MIPWHERTAAVARHPILVGLGRDAVEQLRVEAFARDLAAWLAGAPRTELGVLARVVTAVGGRALRDTRAVCLGLPLLAIEASARATSVLWPLLRPRRPEPTPPPPPAPEDGDGDGDGGDAGASTGGASADAAPGEPTEGEGAVAAGLAAADDAGDDEARDPLADAQEVLAALADGLPIDDPELQALAEALGAQSSDAGEALSEALSPVGEQAFEGAREGEELARALESLVPGVGWGLAPGALQATLARRLDVLTELLARLPALRQLVDRLGRAVSEDRRQAHEHGGSEEVTGVRLSGEAAHALPSELALLGDDDTEDLFYQRMLEHRLVSLELSGRGIEGVASPEARGPVIACIDTSGSMAGAPETAAKALVLAVCRRALPQGRSVHLLLFGSRGEHTELRLRRGQGGLEHLLDFLAMGFSGGTDFDTPLLRALELLVERDLLRADILVVTDGYARAAQPVVKAVADARVGRGLRVWSVVLGPGGVDGVAPFSDEVWSVDPQGELAVGLTQRITGLQGTGRLRP